VRLDTEALGRRFASLATDAVVRAPWLWPLFRGPLRRQFDALAPVWDGRRSPQRLAAFEAALDALPEPSERALDLGTGTGRAAVTLARRFPAAEVVGVDVSERMVAQARRLLPPELGGRVRLEVADAARLPFPAGSFDLVALANMIPFWDELARVTALGGHVVCAFSHGPRTPIHVSEERLEAELGRRGFGDFTRLAAGGGTALVARRGPIV
jgi:SAM-dependent methyltransferase